MSDGNILIVEDNKDFSEILTRTFESQGFKVIEAANAFDALGLVLGGFKGEVDAILTDVHMVNGDGPSLVKALSEMKSLVPIYFMTGDPEFNHRMATELGANGVIQKPFDPFDAVEVVRTALAKHRRESPRSA